MSWKAKQPNKTHLDPANLNLIQNGRAESNNICPYYKFQFGQGGIHSTHTESLAHTQIQNCPSALQKLGDLLRWILQENIPGEFPYTQEFILSKEKAKIPPHVCRRGWPGTTNRRFHYVSFTPRPKDYPPHLIRYIIWK